MKAQVLSKYDPAMKEAVWVENKEMSNPTIEKASDCYCKNWSCGSMSYRFAHYRGCLGAHTRSRWKAFTMRNGS